MLEMKEGTFTALPAQTPTFRHPIKMQWLVLPLVNLYVPEIHRCTVRSLFNSFTMLLNFVKLFHHSTEFSIVTEDISAIISVSLLT